MILERGDGVDEESKGQGGGSENDISSRRPSLTQADLFIEHPEPLRLSRSTMLRDTCPLYPTLPSVFSGSASATDARTLGRLGVVRYYYNRRRSLERQAFENSINAM